MNYNTLKIGKSYALYSTTLDIFLIMTKINKKELHLDFGVTTGIGTIIKQKVKLRPTDIFLGEL